MSAVLRSVGAVAAVVCAFAAMAQSAEVPPEFWDRPRTGRALLEQDSVKQVIQSALAKPGAELVIHHGSGQEPQLQAEELRSWLGALAIDPRRITLRGGLVEGAPVKIEIVP